jgi:hypothetical protein
MPGHLPLAFTTRIMIGHRCVGYIFAMRTYCAVTIRRMGPSHPHILARAGCRLGSGLVS